MIISYDLHAKILIEGVEIVFGESREIVRNKLKQRHHADDQTIQLGDTNLNQRRDIYKNLNKSENIFFLGFVRQWLSTQGYKQQFEFGIKTLKQFGWKP